MANDLKDTLEKHFADAIASKKLVVTTIPVDSEGKPKVGLHGDHENLFGHQYCIQDSTRQVMQLYDLRFMFVRAN